MVLRRFSFLIACPLAGLLSLLLLGCAGSSDDPNGTPLLVNRGDIPGDLVVPTGAAGTTGTPPGNGGAGSTGAPNCATPNQGCACAEPGKKVDCGEVTYRTGDYVSCSQGVRTCQGGTWGDCIGDSFTGAIAPPLTPKYFPLALGASTQCTNNPCDPYCNNYQDNAQGLPVGAGGGGGITVKDNALTIRGQPPSELGPACTGLIVTPGNAATNVNEGPAKFLSGGLYGEYFNQFDLTQLNPAWTPTGTRRDATINFDWSAAGPGVSGIGQSNYSVRWTGKVVPPTTGSYKFETNTDDAVRLWVNNVKLVDQWLQQGPTKYSGTITLTAGQSYDIRMEYNQGGGGAAAELRWTGPSVPYQIIPATALYSNTTLGSFAFVPATTQFTAQLQPINCYPGPFVPAWTIDRPDIATVDDKGLFTLFTPTAAVIRVSAYAGSLVGQASLKVVVNVIDTSNAPSGITNASFASSPSPQPDPISIVYPYNQTIFPLGITSPVLQWKTGGTSADAVKITLRYPTTGIPLFQSSVVTSETNPPRFTFPASTWEALQQTAKGNSFLVSIQRILGGTPYAPVTRTFQLANAELRGRIYYTQYDQRNGRASELSVNPSTAAPPVPTFPGSSGCPVCHTVSASGNRYVTSSGWGDATSSGVSRINANSTLTKLSNPINASPYTDNASDYRGFAWSPITPNGQLLLAANNFWGNTSGGFIGNGKNNGNNGNGGFYYVWRIPDTPGAIVDATSESANRWGLGTSVMMVPSFSPDGKKLVFLNGDGWGGSGWRKGLSTFDFDQANKTFSNRKLAVNTWPNGNVMKWPTFESDSKSVIYQTSDTKDSNFYPGYYEEYGSMAPTNKGTVPGKLWSVDTTAATPTPVALDRLNQGENAFDTNKSYQVTMLPKQAGGYRWVVFTSTRPYGNTLNTPEEGNQRDYSNANLYTPAPNAALQAQLWVAPIDDSVSGSQDRSHPAFWLPNQNANINERGYWVLDPCVTVGKTATNLCQTTEQCCGGDTGAAVCRLDVPVDPASPVRHCATVVNPGACGPAGSTCGATTDCCNGLFCAPSSGICTEPPPIVLYASTNYVRSPDFDGGTCPAGTRVVWRFFQWQTQTPSISYIEFFAQTADDTTTFSSVPVAPTTVTTAGVFPVGVAAGAATTTWTAAADGKTIDDRLRALGAVSKRYLRVTARFAPSNDLVYAPSLSDWRTTFSCVPSE